MFVCPDKTLLTTKEKNSRLGGSFSPYIWEEEGKVGGTHIKTKEESPNMKKR